MAGTLRKVLYFLGILEDSDIEWIVRTGSRQSVKAGAVVITEGNALDSLYFILEGEFSVTSRRSAGEIARLRAGEILGEMSFVDERPPSATVTALTNSTIGIVPRTELDRKLARDVGFAARFYKSLAVLLSHRLRNTVRTLNYGDESRQQRDEDEDEELPPHLLDAISIAGNRFAQMQLRGWG